MLHTYIHLLSWLQKQKWQNYEKKFKKNLQSWRFLSRLISFIGAVLESSYTESSYKNPVPVPHVCTPCPLRNPLPQWSICYSRWACISRHYHLQFIVYIRVHSWCCSFHGFWQICIMYPPAWCHTEQFWLSWKPSGFHLFIFSSTLLLLLLLSHISRVRLCATP